jgi:hypothetical protein
MPRTHRRAGPVTRLSLDALLAENPPCTGDHGDVIDLYSRGPDLDMGDTELRVLEAAWEDLKLQVYRRHREYGCPWDPGCGGAPFDGCEFAGKPEEIGCRPWFEQQMSRRRDTRRTR